MSKFCGAATEYIENQYKGNMIGWLFWGTETYNILEELDPHCYVETGSKLRPYIECNSRKAVEFLKGGGSDDC